MNELSGVFNQVIKSILYPMVSYAIKKRITFKTFSLILKQTYLEVATELPGQLNMSELSVRTGIPRKQISEFYQNLETSVAVQSIDSTDITLTYPQRVIKNWRTLIEAKKVTHILPYRKQEDDSYSFSKIVKDTVGSITPHVIKEALEEDGFLSVSRDKQQITLIDKPFITISSSHQSNSALNKAGENGAHMLNTLFHNLDLAETYGDSEISEDDRKKYFTELSAIEDIDDSMMDDLKTYLDERARDFVEVCNDKIEDLEKQSVSMKKNRTTVGIGVYYLQKNEK